MRTDPETPDSLMQVHRLAIGDEELAVVSLPRPELVRTRELTAAERQVVALVLEGWPNRDIAARRGVSIHTVANQLATVYRKLGVGSRVELMRLVSIER